MYYRIKGNYKIKTDQIVLESQAEFSSDTYFNLFDADSWIKYTDIRQVVLAVTVAGAGEIILMEMKRGGEKERERICFDKEEATTYQFLIKGSELQGMFYICLKAKQNVCFFGASFSTLEMEKRNVKLSLIICTYKREKQLKKSLNQLSESDFFCPGSDKEGALCIRIVDNASELKEEKEKNKYIYHNKNTGGAGGFTRGILETRKDLKRFPATHILLMDDDAEFLLEAFYRLYALLSFQKEEWLAEVVAGRMFCLNQREVQFTASDIWNGGFIQHVGYQENMCLKENLYQINQERGEYSGWWFACFPMEFALSNLPVPFFLHCDDVEYGLRHGGQPIVLNGIQVWHEVGESKHSVSIHYYDVRNTAFTNTMISDPKSKFYLVKCWFLGMLSNIRHRRWKREYMKMLAIKDYCRGKEWLYQIDPQENHKRICEEAKKSVPMILVLVRELGLWIKVLCKSRK